MDIVTYALAKKLTNGDISDFEEKIRTIESTLTDSLDFIGIGAGFHNSIYRGKLLGTAVTDEQYAQISNGEFAGLYIGDYWTINDVNWRIAAFDYYYQTGDTPCTAHHVVIVPDTSLYTAQYHVTVTGKAEPEAEANTTKGGYVGSDLYTGKSSDGHDATNHKGLYDEEKGALGIINNAFGAEHILKHRQILVNAVTNGRPSAAAWYDSKVELMTEQNVYGGKIFGSMSDGSVVFINYTIDKSQFPLFMFNAWNSQMTRNWFWLRDVVSATNFALVSSRGAAYCNGASNVGGVRPAFSIIA